ncbi:MAG: sulfite exporter TauE/SafE family protein [Deltaproteobacteria bacterium]|nr:sulfite exporter TauE/SafE family protein [Deltaproteobacteria bacterium]MBW2117826.1 sulfite exporter TauE/SafE family protein [Deltaproteobacteria bacterium]MBW2344897.1 sulfite exporter TauE/SafE family protein [Deltaproteobacteria bacterium]
MFILLMVGGIVAGMLGGLLGIGGGILIMSILRFMVGLDPAHAAGTCVVAVFFTTLGGSIKHFRLGHIDFRSILPVIIPGLISTIIFSILFVYISHKDAWLDMATGVVFSLVALRMLWEGISEYLVKGSEPDTGSSIRGSTFAKMGIGTTAGVLPGLLGIGTGAVLVPTFAFALNAPIKIAIGSSLACFSLNALASSVLKMSQGFVEMNILIPLCIGTFIGSRFGATLNGRSSSRFLKFIFGMVFVYVAYKYLFVLGSL